MNRITQKAHKRQGVVKHATDNRLQKIKKPGKFRTFLALWITRFLLHRPLAKKGEKNGGWGIDKIANMCYFITAIDKNSKRWLLWK